MNRFTFLPTNQASGEINFRISRAQFGDGYAQTAGDGLNGKESAWNLNFVGSKTYINDVKSFFDSLQGYQSFLWAPPGEDLGMWKAQKYNKKPLGGNTFSLDIVFNQSFQP